MIYSRLPHEEEQLGEWIVEHKLGEGRSAIVYQCRHQHKNVYGALKLLHPHVCEHPEQVQRFAQEARTLHQLAHANIVQILDVGHDSMYGPFLVMELLFGWVLETFLSSVPFRLSWVTHLAKQLCAGLAASHQVGIVHRDLKPGNICLLAPLERPHVKLIDFGLAKDTQTSTALTAPGTVLGTPAYMAPEQISCTRPITPRTDVYSLGVVLYELLTGELPIRCPRLTRQLFAVLYEQPTPLSHYRPEFAGSALEILLQHMLAKEPTERPASPKDVWHRLRTCTAAEILPQLPPHQQQEVDNTQTILEVPCVFATSPQLSDVTEQQFDTEIDPKHEITVPVHTLAHFGLWGEDSNSNK